MLDTVISRLDMEAQRLAAAEDFRAGKSQTAVARKYGVSRTTASRWNQTFKSKGIEALKSTRATGRPCRLTADQLAKLPAIFAAGPIKFGFGNARWTNGRLRSVIEKEFGVRYGSPDHVGRLMIKLNLRKSLRHFRNSRTVSIASCKPLG